MFRHNIFLSAGLLVYPKLHSCLSCHTHASPMLNLTPWLTLILPVCLSKHCTAHTNCLPSSQLAAVCYTLLTELAKLQNIL